MHTTAPSLTAARALLDAAMKVEADERQLKERMLACARIREFDRMVEMLEQWLSRPAAEVLASCPDPAPGPGRVPLDPCGGLEVTPPVGPKE